MSGNELCCSGLSKCYICADMNIYLDITLCNNLIIAYKKMFLFITTNWSPSMKYRFSAFTDVSILVRSRR